MKDTPSSIISSLRLVLILLFSSAGFAQETAATGGLSITTVCGIGCKTPGQVCDAHVLTEAQYEKRIKDPLSFDLDAVGIKGRTPFSVPDLTPGTYYVAVTAEIDTGEIPEPGFNETVEEKVEEYFVDDLADGSGLTFAVRNGQFYQGLTKFYSVSVDRGRVTHAVALFLPSEGTLEQWEEYYPTKETFTIETAETVIQDLWDGLASQGASTSAQQRRAMLTLLKRGGRVVVPGDTPWVLSLDSQNQVIARSGIRVQGMN